MTKLKLLRGHTVFVDSIKTGSLIVDCGSHRGEFAREILDISAVRVHGFEANPDLFNQLPSLENAHFFNKAVTGFDGTTSFSMQEPECGSIRFTNNDGKLVSVECIQLETHLKSSFRDGDSKHINLLKLDIEGAELDVIENVSLELLAKIDQLCKEDIPRILNCVEKLKNSGFLFFRFSFFTWGDCLFINAKNVCISPADRMAIYYYKYSSGLTRITKKFAKKFLFFWA